MTELALYEGNTLLASSTSVPFLFTWTGVPIGTHSVTAVTKDNNGKVGVSAPATFRVDAPPTVTLTSPAPGTVFTAPASITLRATASDTDGYVTQVKFYANGTLVGTVTTAPYSCVWSPSSTGNYTLTAKATDNDGAVTTSTSVAIHVD